MVLPLKLQFKKAYGIARAARVDPNSKRILDMLIQEFPSIAYAAIRVALCR